MKRAEPAGEQQDRSARVARLSAYRWKPGQSGNPNGKAGVLAKRIRQATNQGRELFEFLLEVMRNPKESTRHRLAACGMLLDRAFGRPRQDIDVLGARGRHSGRQRAVTLAALESLPLNVLDELQGALANATTPPPSKLPSGSV